MSYNAIGPTVFDSYWLFLVKYLNIDIQNNINNNLVPF